MCKMHIYSNVMCGDPLLTEADGTGSALPDSTGEGQSGLAASVGRAALAVLRPLARLFVSQGLTYSAAEKLLKRAFYDAGVHELGRACIPVNVSRISVSTGLHRRDVKRLNEAVRSKEPIPSDAGWRSLASEIYLRWSTLPQLEQGDSSLPLRPTPGEYSFDELARATNMDAHPRAVLEELKRLGLISVDEKLQRVALKAGGFVPLEERSSMLGLLGDNVAAHIDTAVCNVLEGGPKRLEQAIYEHDLTLDTVDRIEALSREIWANASQTLVPALIAAGEESANRGGVDDPERFQVRIGMYLYTNAPRTDKQDTVQDSGNTYEYK